MSDNEEITSEDFAKAKPERKPATPATRRVLPMELRIGDASSARPGRVGSHQPAWRAHEHVSVKRATTEEASDDVIRRPGRRGLPE